MKAPIIVAVVVAVGAGAGFAGYRYALHQRPAAALAPTAATPAGERTNH